MRKLRKVQKRQGPLSSEETDNTNENQGPREPLYQEHEDEIQAPEHYYSPIRRQRMRSQKLFTQSHNVPQQFHKSLVESPSNQNIRKRERERNYFENLNNGGQHEEYSQSTQPVRYKKFLYEFANGVMQFPRSSLLRTTLSHTPYEMMRIKKTTTFLTKKVDLHIQIKCVVQF